MARPLQAHPLLRAPTVLLVSWQAHQARLSVHSQLEAETEKDRKKEDSLVVARRSLVFPMPLSCLCVATLHYVLAVLSENNKITCITVVNPYKG